MLYSEYKPKYCYFEVVKLFMKLSLVVIINNIADDALLLFTLNVLLSLYFILTSKLVPFIYWKTQMIDQEQIFILMLSVQTIYTLKNLQDLWIQYVLVVLMSLLNGFLLLKIFWNILHVYI
jgi:hypothetical protein